jgi:hypothetical protein
MKANELWRISKQLEEIDRVIHMEVYNTKGVIMYPLAFFAMLILLNGYCCGGAAVVLVKSNTTFRCDGRLDECLIEDDLELEFLMNPYVSRVLSGTGGPKPLTGGTDVRTKPIVQPPCAGPRDAYGTCIAKFKDPDNHPCVPNSKYDRCLRGNKSSPPNRVN